MDNPIAQPLRHLSWVGATSPAWFLMTHAVDFVMSVMGGTVARAFATGSQRVLAGQGVATPDYIRATLLFADGRDATLDVCWVVPDSMPVAAGTRFDIIAERATHRIDTFNQMASAAGERYEHLRTVETTLFGRSVGVHAAALDTFVDLLDGRLSQDEVPGTRDGVVNTEILVAVHQSLRTGRIEPVGGRG